MANLEDEIQTNGEVNRTLAYRCCTGCSLLCRQFFLLLWKNFILQIRRPIGTIFEILVPLLAVVVIVVFRVSLFKAEDKCFVTFESDPLVIPTIGSYDVYYAPNTSQSALNISRIIEPMLKASGGNLIGVATEDQFVDIIHQDNSNRSAGCFLEGAGIYFEDLDTNNIKYSLRLRQNPPPFDRWFTQFRVTRFQIRGARVEPNSYLKEGFMHLEKIVNEAIIQYKSGQTVNMDINVRQFPYPQYRSDTFLQIVDFILPLFVVLSFIYSAGVFVKELVLEKETRIRETMKIMGLSNWVLWTTWFLKQLLFYLLPIIFMTILLKYGTVFPKSDGFLIFIYLLMYVVSGISFCFFISVWFSSARIGLMAGFILWFVAYFPYLFVSPNYETLNLGAKLGICLIPNSCVGFGITVLSILELRQEGLLFSNFAAPLSLDDQLHMGWIVLMLAIDTFIYMLLYWYIDAVKPGTYGVPKPFYFFLLPSYWCGKRFRKPMNADKLAAISDPSYNPEAHEKEPTGIPVGIEIKELTKVYNRRSLKKRKIAVDHLSLKMYKGQITALLGHNGAGKTTTMSILTGLFPPTGGAAYINGLSVVEDIDIIRRNLGICPQHNVLFDRLTVREHLNFFARLKGCPGNRIKKEVEDMIEDLLLSDKKTTQSQKLSGGMKRKLSVGIALVGGSEVVILDEPTSGMDPYARRATWDLLVKHKEGRTILLTTHFMDEADLLGDRIAIMSEGKLRCSGSSLFLKSRYGVGYHMIIVKEPTCDSSVVSSMVKQLVAGAEQVTDVGAELSFILPSQSSYQFPQLFDILDDRKENLGISSFGVSVTTMEEVFIRVASGTDELLLQESRLLQQLSHRERSKSPIHFEPVKSTATETTFLNDIEDEDGEVQTVQMVFENEEAEYPTPVATPISHPGKIGRPSILQMTEEGSAGVKIHENGTNYYGTFRPRLSLLAVNTGLVLWFQQFCAIFLKRFYNSIRFWVAIIWQLFIPMVFVLWGLILGKTLPGLNNDDPSRLLSIVNSAPSENISFFFAHFGPQDSNIFRPDDRSFLGITDYFDYTDSIHAINNSVKAHANISECCGYRFQMLDKFCATRNIDDLKINGNTICPNNNNFGYRPCPECLRCCTAKRNRLETCTNPFHLNNAERSADGFCPFPPSVSIADQYNGPPTGPLDNINVYVAEHLLRISSEVDIYDFNLRFQGGYVVHSPEPTYSICGCKDNPDQSCDHLAGALRREEESGSGPGTDGNMRSNIMQPSLNLNLNNLDNLCPAVQNASCSELDSNHWNYYYNFMIEQCSNIYSCINTTTSCCSTGDNQCQIGETSQPPPRPAVRPAVTVWYNNQPYHMGAAALNGFYNLYLKSLNSNVTISVSNDPLPRDIDDQIEDAEGEFLGFTISSTSIFGLSFLFASFIIFLVQERDTKAKHLQFVSGVQASSYWLATFAWDLVNAFIPAIITVILFAAFQIDGYKGENIGAIFLLVVLGCWASIPVNYIMSFVFSNALVAFCLMLVFFYFGSLIFQVVTFLVQIDYPNTSKNLNYVFLLHPAYALAIGLTNMYTNQGIKNTCEQSLESTLRCEYLGVEYADSVFEFSSPGIGHIFLYMALEGLLFMILTIIIERQAFIPELKRLITLRKRGVTVENGTITFPEEDNDVADERKKVNSMTTYSDSDAVVVKNLIKEYKDASAILCPCWPRCQEGCKLAVNSINLIIPSGECFGLLGVNGAGKTTTFKMLTGDITPTSGTAVLSGFDIGTQLRHVQQHIGYCPQFDALIERLTGRELLTMFARLRGIPEKNIKAAVQTEIDRLDLNKYANKRCGTYSGGNKRKLSTAVSLVGNPPILLLDEPTTGMDPATRRFLWDVLTNVIREGRSVILTSHSMEECEALCTRLAIMVNGGFKCLGSIQHLKSKFGSGYTLQIKIQPVIAGKMFDQHASSFRSTHRPRSRSPTPTPPSPSHHKGAAPSNPYDTSEIERFITETFPGAHLLEHHQGSVTYQIPAEGVTWSALFRTVEQNKEQFRIIDYSVSQTTLEQVFINFAQEQEEDEL